MTKTTDRPPKRKRLSRAETAKAKGRPIQKKDLKQIVRLLNIYGKEHLIRTIQSRVAYLPMQILEAADLADWIEQKRIEFTPQYKRVALKAAIREAYNMMYGENARDRTPDEPEPPSFDREYERLKKLHKRALPYAIELKEAAGKQTSFSRKKRPGN